MPPLSVNSVAKVDVTPLVVISTWLNVPPELPLARVKRPVPPVNVVTNVPAGVARTVERPAAADIAKQLVAIRGGEGDGTGDGKGARPGGCEHSIEVKGCLPQVAHGPRSIGDESQGPEIEDGGSRPIALDRTIRPTRLAERRRRGQKAEHENQPGDHDHSSRGYHSFGLSRGRLFSGWRPGGPTKQLAGRSSRLHPVQAPKLLLDTEPRNESLTRGYPWVLTPTSPMSTSWRPPLSMQSSGARVGAPSGRARWAAWAPAWCSRQSGSGSFRGPLRASCVPVLPLSHDPRRPEATVKSHSYARLRFLKPCRPDGENLQPEVVLT